MKTLNGFPLIGDDFGPAQHGPDHGTGYTGRDYAAFPRNGFAFNREPTVARLSLKEIVELAKEKTAKKTWITDLADRVGSKVKNQKSSSYCWIHAPVRGLEYAIIYNGDPPKTLAAFHGAWPIKRGSNQGGSGVEGVHSMVKHGVCTEALWPSMQFKGKETPEIIANGLLHQPTIVEEFDQNDHEGIWSSIVQDQPITVGIPAWGHEVLLNFLVPSASDIEGEGFDNSWGTDWGKNGRGVLAGAKRKFDEAMRIAAIEQSVA